MTGKETPPARGPLIIAKKNEEEFQQWVATEAGFLTTFARFSDAELKLESYQKAFLDTRASMRCIEKARQTGYSFVFALEALARSHLRPQHTSIFVSYNLADAKEKIAYCQQLHDELPLAYQKKRITDSKLELAFRSNGVRGSVSRIISNPSKAPRGKNGDVYLDELAHCVNDREIYAGSTALILRKAAQLSICSSPLGRRGVFWEIARQELRAYPTFWRQKVPWWLCSFFCRDVLKAAKEAPALSTEERVERFGKKNIRDQLASMLLEDFQQEYEVVYSDETLTFFPYELILPCTRDEDVLTLATDFAELAQYEGRLVAGFDVGRRRDLSVLSVFEEKGDRMICRMIREYDRAPFEMQEHDLELLMSTATVGRLSIDSNGLGMNLAENLKKKYPQVVEENFTATNKETWCTDLKIKMQKKQVEIPRTRALLNEIHAVKKNVTGAGRVSFEVERDKKGHGDTFWSIALACQKERVLQQRTAEVGVRSVG